MEKKLWSKLRFLRLCKSKIVFSFQSTVFDLLQKIVKITKNRNLNLLELITRSWKNHIQLSKRWFYFHIFHFFIIWRLYKIIIQKNLSLQTTSFNLNGESTCALNHIFTVLMFWIKYITSTWRCKRHKSDNKPSRESA